MTDTVRLLVERIGCEDLDYPLHLGVTEAGNALEGRIKSSVGIGSLLSGQHRHYQGIAQRTLATRYL